MNTYDYTEDCMDDDGSYLVALIFIVLLLALIAGLIYGVIHLIVKGVANFFIGIGACFTESVANAMQRRTQKSEQAKA